MQKEKSMKRKKNKDKSLCNQTDKLEDNNFRPGKHIHFDEEKSKVLIRKSDNAVLNPMHKKKSKENVKRVKKGSNIGLTNCFETRTEDSVELQSNDHTVKMETCQMVGKELVKNNRHKGKSKHKKNRINVFNEVQHNHSEVCEAPKDTYLDEGITIKKERKRKKKLKIKEQEANENIICSDKEPNIKKEKTVSNEKVYKVGMLSESLQIKKFGRLIIPYDPSFGLDPNYKIPDSDGNGPKLKINPLFDLSKRPTVSENTLPAEAHASMTVFVGNLPPDTTTLSVQRLFRNIGVISKVKLSNNLKKSQEKLSNKQKIIVEDTRPKNAIVKFKSSQSCEDALKFNGKLYKGHHLRVTLAKDYGKYDTEKINRNKSIFVGNLAFNAQDDDLWQAFRDCGEIESVRIIRKQKTSKGTGYGYVNFKSADSVEQALGLNGVTIHDRGVRVSRINSDARSMSDTVLVKRRKKRRRKFSNSKHEFEGTEHKEEKTEDLENQVKLGKNTSVKRRKSNEVKEEDNESPLCKKPKKKKIKKKNRSSLDAI